MCWPAEGERPLCCWTSMVSDLNVVSECGETRTIRPALARYGSLEDAALWLCSDGNAQLLVGMSTSTRNVRG
jgi:hypothetical protein